MCYDAEQSGGNLARVVHAHAPERCMAIIIDVDRRSIPTIAVVVISAPRPVLFSVAATTTRTSTTTIGGTA